LRIPRSYPTTTTTTTTAMFGTMRRLRIPLVFASLFYWSVAGSAPSLRPSLEERGAGDSQQQPLHGPTGTSRTLPALLNALDVLQTEYFANWQGIWPTSIDWTSAVIGTYLSSALSTISTSFPSLSSEKAAENTINKYYSQLVASYFGQDAFSLRQEAYDDMLWVVLGWLESIKFVKTHSKLHFADTSEWRGEQWHGEQWTPAFAHRARLFWDLASQGWDTSLCNGGMIWSPYLVPYKNAITNELYITASISMYLYFPGDNNTSPFGFSPPPTPQSTADQAREPIYLNAAVEAYKWLVDSNMTDEKGLYVDGYHISGWSRRQRPGGPKPNTRCDARNEMVYTYNQGVLLSGQRGLYEATGARSYLQDGHRLVSDVIAATGWDLESGKVRGQSQSPEEGLGQWHGLGRSGILEEVCDAPGYCSQDAQTFKGIFFHHLTLFCTELPDNLVLPSSLFLTRDIPSGHAYVKLWHSKQCARYGPWIKRNADGALSTLDHRGRFGMWWGAPAHTNSKPDTKDNLPPLAIDYRNDGVPVQWTYGKSTHGRVQRANNDFVGDRHSIGTWDLNDRGRGRTVETQGGGISVLRALWELVDSK
jgi:hypothetical protein